MPELMDIKVRKNIEYGQAGGESLKLDLYRPEDGSGLRPGLVFVHGGGWCEGDKEGWSEKAVEMARRGYVAISVNYRLAPQHRYPAGLDDVRAAVRWFRSQAVEYNLDRRRIGAVGDSAGGHLAAFLGLYGPTNSAFPEDASVSRVHCVVNYFGRMDLTMEPTSESYTDFREAFIGKTKDEALELYQEASPVRYVNANASPFLILQGTKDGQVEPIQSQKMFGALDAAGVEASLLMLAGAGHGFEGAPAELAWDAAKSFLDRHLLRSTGR
jgi:acetyl esterase/lipase